MLSVILIPLDYDCRCIDSNVESYGLGGLELGATHVPARRITKKGMPTFRVQPGASATY